MIAAIALVAIVMGFATWPLLKIRRQKEIRRTEVLLEMLSGDCEQYRARHGRYPAALPGRPRDAWGRPIQYSRWSPGWAVLRYDLTSLGPDPEDPRDDITVKMIFYP